jgi:hypothetical protein
MHLFMCRALDHVLTTGNVQCYPPVCANVTATFSVLSSTINAIRSNVERRENQPNVREIRELLTRLQRAEQSKLQLTAALHLERMRSVAEAEQQGTVSMLLNESILLLRQKIALSIGEINDVLEELRYTIPES